MLINAFILGAAVAATTTLALPVTVVQVMQLTVALQKTVRTSQLQGLFKEALPFEEVLDEPAVVGVLEEESLATHNGDATYFFQDGAAGSCGKKHSDSDHIVAISAKYPAPPNALCGKSLTIKHNGKSVKATVADTCPGCSGAYDLDLSVGAIKVLDSNYEVDGRISIEWYLD